MKEIRPEEIEKRSFEIIEEELDMELDPEQKPIIKRCIHTSADFDYATNLCFSKDALASARNAILDGATIITDTNMGKAGINQAALSFFHMKALCFMADDDVRQIAKEQQITRAIASMNKATELEGKLIFAIGNAPTALVRLYELIEEGKVKPELVIGVPVGFVNVVESKELIMTADVPYIVAKGRKGGSNIAAAICNALLYQQTEYHRT